MKAVTQKIKIENQDELNDIFQSLMTGKDAEKYIVVPKLVNTRNILRKICNILSQFAEFKTLRNDFPHIIKDLDEIVEFVKNMRESVIIDNKIETEYLYRNTSETDVNLIYKNIKANKYVKICVVLCSILDKIKDNFTNLTPAKENFINLEPGNSYVLLNFCSLDFKLLWANEKMTSNIKKYIINILAHLHKLSMELYKTVTSPDVDLDDISYKFIHIIDKLKTIPKLSRCHAAFAKIADSVGILKCNFPGYYREILATNNSGNLFTSFIADVVNESKSNLNPSVIREFNVILSYFKDTAAKNGQMASDPKLNLLFNSVDMYMNKYKDNVNYEETHEEILNKSTNIKNIYDNISNQPTPELTESDILKIQINNMMK
jgi:hypothetical protein